MLKPTRNDGRWRAGARLTLSKPELLDDWPRSRENVFVRNKEVYFVIFCVQVKSCENKKEQGGIFFIFCVQFKSCNKKKGTRRYFVIISCGPGPRVLGRFYCNVKSCVEFCCLCKNLQHHWLLKIRKKQCNEPTLLEA